MSTSYKLKYKLLELKHILKEFFLLNRIALKSSTTAKPFPERPLYIAIIDGTAKHGGMCDRFKGIITLYAYCKYNNLPFRIKYTYPFNLEDYLLPAEYDWTLKENEYTDNPKYCRILYMRKEYLARRLLKLKTMKQIHFYSNRDCLDYINQAYSSERESASYFKWGDLFHELFRPNQDLKNRIDQIKSELGDNYSAAVFRFQNLLGDFKEYSFKAIDNQEGTKELIEKCVRSVRRIKAEIGEGNLLVTSDSVTFLKTVLQVEGVYVIPGTLMHMDGNKEHIKKELQYEAHIKSFLDFYVLSGAQKIYRIGTSYMYPSEFPVYAAKLQEVPFESIII